MDPTAYAIVMTFVAAAGWILAVAFGADARKARAKLKPFLSFDPDGDGKPGGYWKR